jgi:hypothetical protein
MYHNVTPTRESKFVVQVLQNYRCRLLSKHKHTNNVRRFKDSSCVMRGKETHAPFCSSLRVNFHHTPPLVAHQDISSYACGCHKLGAASGCRWRHQRRAAIKNQTNGHVYMTHAFVYKGTCDISRHEISQGECYVEMLLNRPEKQCSCIYSSYNTPSQLLTTPSSPAPPFLPFLLLPQLSTHSTPQPSPPSPL